MRFAKEVNAFFNLQGPDSETTAILLRNVIRHITLKCRQRVKPMDLLTATCCYFLPSHNE